MHLTFGGAFLARLDTAGLFYLNWLLIYLAANAGEETVPTNRMLRSLGCHYKVSDSVDVKLRVLRRWLNDLRDDAFHV